VYEDVNDNFTTMKPTLYHHQSYPTKAFTTLSMDDDITMTTTPMTTQEPTSSAPPAPTLISLQEKSKATILEEMRKNKLANFKASMQYPKVFNKNNDGTQQQQQQNLKAHPIKR
jgi:hypothetical protein